jgi:hypothetical protein
VPAAAGVRDDQGAADGTSDEPVEMLVEELPEWATDPRQEKEEPATGALADGMSQPPYVLKTYRSGRVRFLPPPELFSSFGAEPDE